MCRNCPSQHGPLEIIVVYIITVSSLASVHPHTGPTLTYDESYAVLPPNTQCWWVELICFDSGWDSLPLPHNTLSLAATVI